MPTDWEIAPIDKATSRSTNWQTVFCVPLKAIDEQVRSIRGLQAKERMGQLCAPTFVSNTNYSTN